MLGGCGRVCGCVVATSAFAVAFACAVAVVFAVAFAVAFAYAVAVVIVVVFAIVAACRSTPQFHAKTNNKYANHAKIIKKGANIYPKSTKMVPWSALGGVWEADWKRNRKGASARLRFFCYLSELL